MGYETGAVKYFFGMLTSGWGLITAYLYMDGLLHPMDYILGFAHILRNLNNPKEILRGFLSIFITTPSEFAKLAVTGLALMTILWYLGSKFD
ncbi:hypothetical protein ACFQJ5_06130 [Halomicroarcula sp. GCM10025324]|uniref:hypothetical protein n=1 Tax=Haloarcula TaxID=2237 RepID=UPI0023E86B63|nr:hypothetical protein [Halomicroarcula sp. ZS-22-S1]